MNAGAAKLIRRSTAAIQDPQARAAARELLERSWREGNHEERAELRRLMLLRARG